MRYAQLGELPPKRHSQFRQNGSLLVEEVMGYEGFSGNESILYHTGSPCRIAAASEARKDWDDAGRIDNDKEGNQRRSEKREH